MQGIVFFVEQWLKYLAGHDFPELQGPDPQILLKDTFFITQDKGCHGHRRDQHDNDNGQRKADCDPFVKADSHGQEAA